MLGLNHRPEQASCGDGSSTAQQSQIDSPFSPVPFTKELFQGMGDLAPVCAEHDPPDTLSNWRRFSESVMQTGV